MRHLTHPAIVTALLIVGAVCVLLARQDPKQKPPAMCRIPAECGNAYYYTSRTTIHTTVASRCSPIVCVTLLEGPDVRACVQTRYGMPWEVAFRPLDVCRAALR